MPTDCGVDFVESFARRAFHADAGSADATQVHAAFWRLKLKVIWAAEKLGALGVLHFQRFAVLAEKARRVVGVVERQAVHQRRLFGFLVLETA